MMKLHCLVVMPVYKVREENERLREENVALREELEELKSVLALHQNCGNIGWVDKNIFLNIALIFAFRSEDKNHGSTPSFMLPSLKSPPQTVPEDLRVQRL